MKVHSTGDKVTMPGYFALLDGHDFMSLKTFRKSGAAVPTPVWFAADGERLVVLTEADSGKAKRIRNSGAVEIAPCNWSGKLLGVDYVPAQARLLPAGPESEQADRLLSRKYGWQKKLFEVAGRFRRREEVFLEIVAPARAHEG